VGRCNWLGSDRLLLLSVDKRVPRPRERSSRGKGGCAADDISSSYWWEAT